MPSGVTASNSFFLGFSLPVVEKPPETCLCVYLPYLGAGTHSLFGQLGEGRVF